MTLPVALLGLGSYPFAGDDQRGLGKAGGHQR